MLANPPFGVEWKKVKDEVEDEAELGYGGRFGAGLPRINDGSFLFLQHMISKMQPVASKGGCRLAIVFNGSPLFTGAAESGESKIRRWILENDWLEGIVALPDQLFYNTGISTYFWILTNRKRPGALRARSSCSTPATSGSRCASRLGDKRKLITERRSSTSPRCTPTRSRSPTTRSTRHHAKVKVFRTTRLRLPPHHGRTAAQAALRDHRGHARGAGDASR